MGGSRRARLAGLVLVSTLLAAASDGAELEIRDIKPSGIDVPPGRQIVLQFDRAVVPIGKMDRDAGEIPVSIQPAVACAWRWLDTAALACQLGEEQALRPATRYRMRIEPGIETLEGVGMGSPVVHEFVTARPRVIGSSFDRWRAPAVPRIAVILNQGAEGSAVEASLRFEADGHEPIALTAEPRNPKQPDPRRWVVTPVQDLPGGSESRLHVRPGLVSFEGPEPGIEDRTIVAFDTFPDFRFLGIECRDNGRRKLRVLADAKVSSERSCNPLESARLLFTAPVLKEALVPHLGVDPDLAGGRTDFDPWGGLHSYSRLRSVHRKTHDYRIALPRPLRADHEYRLTAAAADVEDEFGRPLEAPIDFRFRTDDRPPLAKLTHPISVLEATVDTHLPLVVTNLDEIQGRFRAMPGATEPREERLAVGRAWNIAYLFPLPVREWLGRRSGAMVGSIGAKPTAGAGEFFTQVTPFQVHVKAGHRNTLVWVTDLASGLPVADARVRVFSARRMSLPQGEDALATATTEADGVAMLPGVSELDPKVERLQPWRSLLHERDRRDFLYVRIDRGDDLALLPLSSDFHVDARGPNRSWIPNHLRQRHGRIRTWGTTAQGIYRLGDDLEYKIYVRDQGNLHLEPAPEGPWTLEVRDPTDKVVHRREDLRLDAFGALDGGFALPEGGAVGWYRFTLEAGFADGLVWQPLNVLVADFTPAPFRVTTDLSGDLFHPGDDLAVATQAALHAGGPYADAAARVTVRLRPTRLAPKHPKTQGFHFEVNRPRAATLKQSEGRVDSQGRLTTEWTLPESPILYGRLSVESAVRDDRGKFVAASATAGWAARSRYVGLRQPDWLLTAGEPAEVFAMVVDEHGEPVRRAWVDFRIEYDRVTAARVKGAGSAYLTRYEHEWVPVDTCRERTGRKPARCRFTPELPGTHRITATVKDSQGREHVTTLRRWTRGAGQTLWEMPPGHHLSVVPEKAEYRVGETARFLVQNPFPGATALIGTERVGTQQYWQQVFESSTEVVEFQVSEDHIPGFYLSVLVTAPRIGAPPTPGAVDLGKPSFRMGYVRVPVRDPAKEVQVTVTPDRAEYRPREPVHAEIVARTPQGDRPPLQFAVAVLDEAVFDLVAGGRRVFDPYAGFYSLEDLDLENYNLLARLVGFQKFEKKGDNPGGGGSGAAPDLRSLFRYVSYWNPSILADADGRARIRFPVPDNLTAWRVLALAVTPEDRLGLGDASFRVNRPTEIRPALPNQVLEGDRFEARFTVMNRTPGPRTLRVDARVSGPATSEGLAGKRVEAAPYQRVELAFPVQTLSDGILRLQIEARDDLDGDALEQVIPIGRRQATEVAASYASTTDDELTETLQWPDGIRTDVGGLSVVTSASVVGGVDGAFRYMRRYPYQCWEQRLSKAVMASHFAKLRDYLPAELPPDLVWDGHETLPDQTLATAANFQAPNGGMVYWVAQDRYVSPYLSAYTALAFEWLRERGHAIPAGVDEKLQDYLEGLLRRDVFPSFFSQGMASSVRAVALAALAERGRVTRADLRRYRPQLGRMDLFGKAHYLLAASQVKGAEAIRREARAAILAHADQSGGKYRFAESLDTGFERILHTELRSNCAILSTLVRSGGDAPGGSGVGDVPFRLMRFVTQSRKSRDHWPNTQENVFCMNAVVDFARVYETDPPRFTVTGRLDGAPLGSARFESVRAPQVEIERPTLPTDPGRRATLTLRKDGPGRLYAATRLFYSPLELRREPVNAGFEVRREYSLERQGRWERLEMPATLRRGDLVRVDLYLSLPGARNFVVLNDAVPGGLEPVNRDLATASGVDAEKGEVPLAGGSYWFSRDDWIPYRHSHWSFYHRELRHDSVRFYADHLPAGNYHLSYVAQAIAPGEFDILPVHAEEMYDPDVFGKGVPGALRVEPMAR